MGKGGVRAGSGVGTRRKGQWQGPAPTQHIIFEVQNTDPTCRPPRAVQGGREGAATAQALLLEHVSDVFQLFLRGLSDPFPWVGGG